MGLFQYSHTVMTDISYQIKRGFFAEHNNGQEIIAERRHFHRFITFISLVTITWCKLLLKLKCVALQLQKLLENSSKLLAEN
jgi:hypothetical protein